MRDPPDVFPGQEIGVIFEHNWVFPLYKIITSFCVCYLYSVTGSFINSIIFSDFSVPVTLQNNYDPGPYLMEVIEKYVLIEGTEIFIDTVIEYKWTL